MESSILELASFKRLKDRHNIVYRSIPGESGEVNAAAMNDWIEDNMKNILNEYALSYICNEGKTGLLYQGIIV